MKLLPIALGLLSLASVNALAAEALSLQGKTIGVAVVGTQHFWDREAYKGATEEVEKLGGKAIGVDAAAITRFMRITTIFYCRVRLMR